jgi:hypothetical protein
MRLKKLSLPMDESAGFSTEFAAADFRRRSLLTTGSPFLGPADFKHLAFHTRLLAKEPQGYFVFPSHHQSP